MKVVKNYKKTTVVFSELRRGDCFRFCDGQFYVKSVCNQAVGLESGYILSNMYVQQVTPVNAEVHIID